jgi:menaquinone C8-methyltransferase
MEFSRKIPVALFVKNHSVLKSGTSAPFDEDTKRLAGVLGLFKHRLDLSRCVLGECYDGFILGGSAHTGVIETSRKSRECQTVPVFHAIQRVQRTTRKPISADLFARTVKRKEEEEQSIVPLVRATDLIDRFLLRAFRFRTRGFLRMEEASGVIPPAPADGVGCLYLHVPFCEALCPFCSFHRVQHQHAQAKRYFESLREEVRCYHQSGYRFSGAYIGGGTPTTEPEELAQTVRLVRDLFEIREISVETNPRDLRPEILEGLRAAGVTRLSVGVQSFDDRLLKEMERYDKYGSGEEACKHIRTAVGIFPTLNVDFIFNQPHQSLASLRRDIEIFRGLGANQVSFYPLMTSATVARRMSGVMGLPDRRRLREFYEAILSGLRPDFEPSSAWCFTRRGQGSDEYIVEADYYAGLGSGAFSYLNGALHVSTFSLQTYERRIAAGLTGIVSCHRLGGSDQMRYALLVRMFGLRLDRAWALRRFGPGFFRALWGELRTLEWLGAAHRNEDGWQLTDRGAYWLMLMMSAFFEAVNEYRDAMRAHVKEELNGVELCVPGCETHRHYDT